MARLPSLRSLLLHTSTDISGDGWAALSALTALTALNVCCSGTLDGPGWGLLASGTALRAVTVLSALGPHVWRALARLQHLETLQVRGLCGVQGLGF